MRGATLEREVGQLGGAALGHGADFTREAGQGIVVKDHRLPVFRQLKVELNAVAMSDGGLKGRQAVFRAARGLSVKAAMGQRPFSKSGWQRGHLISKIPSISTATPSGKDAAETAERAWRPMSPSASTMKSDAPLMTLGCSVKS